MNVKKKSRRNLPDLRPKVYSVPEPKDQHGIDSNLPSKEHIEALGKRHGYPTGFDLVNELQDAWIFWRGDVETGSEPTATEHRRFLQEIARHAKALEEALTKAGSVERSAILNVWGNRNLDFEALRQSVYQLWIGATVGVRSLKATRAGPRGDKATMRLICLLYKINVSAFGESAPRIARAEKYQGRFFDFTSDVFLLFGIDKSNFALGRSIEKAIKIVNKRE